MKNKFIIILLVVCSYLQSSTGGYAGSSYKYGSNARQIALSNSLIASHNTGYNALTNPALLGSINKMEIGFSYFDMSLDRYIQTLSIVIPAPPIASIGLSTYILGTNDIPGTTSGNSPTGLYNAWEGYAMLSFGINFGNFSPGINFKALQNRIASYSADGVGLDLGLLYSISNNIQLAIMFENLYTKYSWDIYDGSNNISYDEEFPLIILGGISAKVNDRNLFLYQIDYISDYEICNHKIGLEVTFDDIEYRFGLNDKNNKLNYSLGFGTPIFKTKNNLSIGLDYAMDTGKINEGMSHLFTFTFFK